MVRKNREEQRKKERRVKWRDGGREKKGGTRDHIDNINSVRCSKY